MDNRKIIIQTKNKSAPLRVSGADIIKIQTKQIEAKSVQRSCSVSVLAEKMKQYGKESVCEACDGKRNICT